MAAPPHSANGTLTGIVALVTALGLLALGHAVVEAPTVPRPVEWVVLAALAVACARFSVHVPGAAVHASLSDTFLFSLVALYGPAPAVIAIAADGLLLSWRRGHSADRLLFNLANPALAMWLGAQAFALVVNHLPTMTIMDVAMPAIFAMAAVHFLVSSGVIAVASGLDKGISPVRLWRDHFLLLSVSHAASASASLFVVLLARSAGILAVVAITPVVGMIYLGLQARFGRLHDAERHVEALDRLYLSTIRAFSTAIEAKDGVTSSHVHRVQSYSVSLARALGVTDALELKALEAAALLHDTGKLAVPEHILNKPGKLTAAEFEQMKLHVDVGADILSSIDFPFPVVPIVAAHHENWDGTGYPRGVAGEAIPLGARILSVVDCYDALTSDRPYRRAMTTDEALAVIAERRGTMYDPHVVDAFRALLPQLSVSAPPPSRLHHAVTRIRTAALQEASAHQGTGLRDGDMSGTIVGRLGRLVSGTPTAEDVAQLIVTDVQQAVPDAAFVLHLARPDGQLEAHPVPGADVVNVAGTSMAVGERVSGWAAATRQQVVNADAQLDCELPLASDAPHFCLATPLVHQGQLVGVLTSYAAAAFTDEAARTVSRYAEGLAPVVAMAVRAAHDAAERSRRSHLRIASRR